MLDHLGWVVHRSYDIGGFIFGIRTNSKAVGQWLDDCLGTYRTRKKADPYYSIHVAEQLGPSTHGYHILYRETLKLARTFDLAGVGRTLLAELESYAFADRDDAVYLDAAVVASDGKVALVPATSALYVATLGGRRVLRAGLRLPAETKVAIDQDSGAAVPIRPQLKVPADALARLSALAPAHKNDDRVAVDRPVQVDAVFSVGASEDPLQPVSPAVALFRLASHALNLATLGTAGLETLRGVIEGARCYEVASGKPQEVLEAFFAGMHAR